VGKVAELNLIDEVLSIKVHGAGMSVGRFLRCCALSLLSTTVIVSGVPQTAPSTTDQVIKFYQAKAAKDPDDIFNYDRLSAAYVQKARESGDITYYQLAETGLKKSLALESKHEEAASAFAELAAVYYAEHRFAEAAKEAQAAIAIAPAPSAYATLGDARLETGDYEEAASSYRHLQDSSGDALPGRAAYLSATRQAGLDWIRGQSSAAISELQNATKIASALHLPAENLAWTHFMLAEQYYQCGKLGEAEGEAKRSLESYPRYHRALAEMGKIRAAQGRFADAIDYYTQAIGIIPLPMYAASLGDTYARTGDKTNAEKQYALVEYIAKISALNKQVYNRELAMFYAAHDRELPRALELAKKELEVRHDVYTHDAVAWALYKNGRTANAMEEMDKALQLSTQDALLMYHAGIIERHSGNETKAREYLQRALEINHNFHVFYADDARNLLKQQAAVAKERDASRP
jgi:tetratricopeptide (TPR) repeat protein